MASPLPPERSDPATRSYHRARGAQESTGGAERSLEISRLARERCVKTKRSHSGQLIRVRPAAAPLRQKRRRIDTRSAAASYAHTVWYRGLKDSRRSSFIVGDQGMVHLHGMPGIRECPFVIEVSIHLSLEVDETIETCVVAHSIALT